ncbi:Protein involved in initiation of plasmid replication [Carnobacterium alterfunditum]|uniref:Protein involved in initiation of plasmid replication n=1 Tax=Carnobacterium alterfunditum TaxID=28230 RepID=A0A1N6IIC9_9LACT|nr:RepB family plasmid replication initiator protein [Carnobacterium alterfunditum]SIO31784.1 Protein involved in initiation of plasmid replication [Carnobacterium alterfunditum]
MLDTYTPNITQKVISMEDLYNKKAVESNDLISSVAKMDKIPLKIFELAVSCLDIENPPKDNAVHISKATLFDFFKVNDNDKHFRFKKALTNLHQQSIFEVKEENEYGKLKYKIISPISSSEWNDFDDNVRIKFTEDIMPYLIDLKRNFTQYLITDIMELNSKYSVILYKWLSMFYNQYEVYKDNGQRREDQLEKLKNPYIDLKELRRITNTVDRYTRFPNFEARVLETATKEITNHTHFNLSYDKVKSGREIVGIRFYIKKVSPKVPLPYKDNSKKAQKSIAETEKEENEIYDNALKSKYVITLVKNDLIESVDILDRRFMVRLSNTIFPLYDTIQKYKGLDGVIEHISYVKSNMIDYDENKKNIIKYLKVSAEDYMKFIKTNNI